jgi:hypothetical protein
MRNHFLLFLQRNLCDILAKHNPSADAYFCQHRPVSHPETEANITLLKNLEYPEAS